MPVIKVFESFDFAEVGRLRSVLEAHGIQTFLRNEFSCSVMGEMPFLEVLPQLFVLQAGEAGRARLIVQAETAAVSTAGRWTCPACQTALEGQFTQCWNCGAGPGVKR